MQQTELLQQLQALRAGLLAGTAGVFYVGAANEGKDTMDGYLTFGMFDAQKGTMTVDFTDVVKFAGLKGIPTESFSMSVRQARGLYSAVQHTYQPGEPVLVGVHPSVNTPIANAVKKAESALSPMTYTTFEAGKDLLKDGPFLESLDAVIAEVMRNTAALTVEGSKVWKRLTAHHTSDPSAARREMAIVLVDQSVGVPRATIAQRLCKHLALPRGAHSIAVLDRELRELDQAVLDDAWVERVSARLELVRGASGHPFRPVDVFELRGPHA